MFVVATRAGYSYLELLVVVALLAALNALAIPRYLAFQHRLAARGAASLLTRALVDARHAAYRRGVRTAVRLDTASATVTVHAAADTLGQYRLYDIFGVALSASRDSMAYNSSGLGYGAANAQYIVMRGAAAETVTVSRVGRVRR